MILPELDLAISTTHLESKSHNNKQRISQIKEIINYGSKFKEHIVAGDFNFHWKWNEQNFIDKKYKDVLIFLKGSKLKH